MKYYKTEYGRIIQSNVELSTNFDICEKCLNKTSCKGVITTGNSCFNWGHYCGYYIEEVSEIDALKIILEDKYENKGWICQ